MKQNSLFRYTLFVAAATLVLLAAGGLVTSTGSGLSVPDWPLSYGQWMPPMIGGIRFEHTHRMIAGMVGILTLVLTFFIFLKEKRAWMKKAGLLASALVLMQALLGGLTVIYLLPDAISVLHACVAQTFFCLLVGLAYFSSREWASETKAAVENGRSLQRLVAIAFFFAYLQLILGAIVRHASGKGLIYHILGALLVALHVLLAVGKVARDPSTRKRLLSHAVTLGLGVILQTFLGFGAFIFKYRLGGDAPGSWTIFFATIHQTLGALLLAGIFLLLLRSLRLFTGPPPQKAAGLAEASWAKP